jgi:hypothetical protein
MQISGDQFTAFNNEEMNFTPEKIVVSKLQVYFV